ncbi:globin family protein [Roseateles violae]|uniref:Globin family protein n=1 Tax=Roseateles violae TaxID=3058042 RepID=A0ABT8DWU8_9BURK|nr:globin family protein [Pelomonas sp. PFR6]MDN3922563.1 globin family protein [Pelomonas sp. PFR6]
MSAVISTQEVALVRRSFALVEPIADTAAALFYGHLFEAAPSLRRLFRGDMAQQGHQLMQMMGAAMRLLDQPEQLLPVLRQLGARHVGYGVQDAHYALVGAALIKTLEQGLGDAFDADTRAAWLAVYGLISRTMMDAAKPELALAA